MKCDRCENEATVHEVVVKSGKRLERHLCESCARSEGVAGQGHIPLTQLLNQFITSHMQPAPGQAKTPGAQPVGGARTVPAGVCPSCGTTLAQFRQSGLLGCPDCYAVFEGQLSPLLQRAHEGGTHHQGKRPQRARQAGSTPAAGAAHPAAGPSPVPVPRPKAKPMAPAPVASSVPPPALPVATPEPDVAAELAERVMQLKSQLNEAVAKEKYEDAARIRDELIKLEQGAAGKPAAKRATRATKQAKTERGPEGAA